MGGTVHPVAQRVAQCRCPTPVTAASSTAIASEGRQGASSRACVGWWRINTLGAHPGRQLCHSLASVPSECVAFGSVATLGPFAAAPAPPPPAPTSAAPARGSCHPVRPLTATPDSPEPPRWEPHPRGHSRAQPPHALCIYGLSRRRCVPSSDTVNSDRDLISLRQHHATTANPLFFKQQKMLARFVCFLFSPLPG